MPGFERPEKCTEFLWLNWHQVWLSLGIKVDTASKKEMQCSWTEATSWRTCVPSIGRVAAPTHRARQGESGSGKELVARAIHANSHRSSRAVLWRECVGAGGDAELRPELFWYRGPYGERGVKGPRAISSSRMKATLFLDEVADLTMTAQAEVVAGFRTWRSTVVGGQSIAAGRHR
jgi:DNA-binding NtrC family response regulator